MNRALSTMLATLAFVAAVVLAHAQPLLADGMVLPSERRPGRSVGEAFTVEDHIVTVGIDGQHAKTSVNQTIKNVSGQTAQAQYFFPVPRNAAISNFSMAVGEKEMAGEMLTAEQAKKIYEDYVRRMTDPALLQYVGQGVFKTSVFPFAPNEAKTLRIAYHEVLTADNGLIHYMYPLNTEKFSAYPLKQVKVEISITAPSPLKAVYSPTHDITVQRLDDRRAIIRYVATGVKPLDDLHLYYTFGESEFGSRSLSFAPGEKSADGTRTGYFIYFFAPDTRAGASDQVVPKDIVFVVDTSGSMQGAKMDQAKEALKFCLERLNAHDRFNVVDFSDSVRSFKDALVAYDKDSKGDSLVYASRLNAQGGTNIDGALERAFAMFSGDKEAGRQRMVVFLTDGMPTVGETNSLKIAANAKSRNQTKQSRLFNFGVGHDVNAILLDWLAEQNHGITQYVDPGENLESAVSSFFNKIKDPVLTDVAFSGVGANVRLRDLHPRPLPDVFAGTQMVIVGRYEIAPESAATTVVAGTVKLTGKIKDKDFVREDAVSFAAGGTDESLSWIEFLWAGRQIGFLINQIRLSEAGAAGNKELIDEVIRLSKRYGIPTEYTSYLVREDTNLRDSAAVHRRGQEEFSNKDKALGEGSNRGVGQSSYNQAKNAQSMQQAQQSQQGNSKGWKDDRGQNFQTNAINNVGRKTFYRRGAQWQDESITDADMKGTVVNVEMYSEAFFALLAEHPEFNQMVANGPVQVKLGTTVYNFVVTPANNEKRDENGKQSQGESPR